MSSKNKGSAQRNIAIVVIIVLILLLLLGGGSGNVGGTSTITTTSNGSTITRTTTISSSGTGSTSLNCTTPKYQIIFANYATQPSHSNPDPISIYVRNTTTFNNIGGFALKVELANSNSLNTIIQTWNLVTSTNSLNYGWTNFTATYPSVGTYYLWANSPTCNNIQQFQLVRSVS